MPEVLCIRLHNFMPGQVQSIVASIYCRDTGTDGSVRDLQVYSSMSASTVSILTYANSILYIRLTISMERSTPCCGSAFN